MTNIPDWNRLRYFFIVAEAKSFSAAEKILNLSQSAISRQISSLETEIKAVLFHRYARGIILTEQGEMLFEIARDIYKQIHEAEAFLIAGKNIPAGSIKITTTRSFGTTWLSKRLVKFCKIYPEINAELMIDDNTVNLSMREADFAIRMWKSRSQDVVANKFVTINCHYYASKEYLEQYGRPEKISELHKHKLLEYRNPNPIMREQLNHHLYFEQSFKRKRKAIYTSTSLKTILHAVQEGLGIATLPDYMVANDMNLEKILSDNYTIFFETYLLYPHEIANAKRIQLFQDYLYECAKDWNY
jgi:DNA-binding transcriptional LysR family regulator